jgi:hypothetical protein
MNTRVPDLIERLKSGGSTQDRLDAIEMLQELSGDRAGPWSLRKHKGSIACYSDIVNADGQPICCVHDDHAAMIVNAVNAYSALEPPAAPKQNKAVVNEILHQLDSRAAWLPNGERGDRLCEEAAALIRRLQSSQPPPAEYGVPHVLAYLKERAEWLRREWQNGGNYSYLHLKEEECLYIAKCIEDTHKRLTATKCASPE